MGAGRCRREISNMQRSFPTFAFLILIAGVIWLLTELEILTIDVPWLPIVVIILALGWIINHYARR